MPVKRRFEWDANKASSNLKKHGISFEEAALVFRDPFSASRLERIEHGEERWQTIGLGSGALLLVVHTWHMETERESMEIIRIISARPATRQERADYEHSQISG